MKSNIINNSSNNIQSPLNLVVALACEARPLIHYFRLKKVNHLSAFTIFENSNEGVSLVVSGIGKIKSAAATVYLHAHSAYSNNAIFLNLGIAGGSLPYFAQTIWVNKITDQATDQSFYPFIFSKNDLIQHALLTCDQPQMIYPQETLLDMEAFGFFQAANLLVNKEQVQVIKIVSDYNDETRNHLKSSIIEQQIESQITRITHFIETFRHFFQGQVSDSSPSIYFEQFLKRWHFTEYQSYELKEILRRLGLIIPALNPLEFTQHLSSSKEILQVLKQYLINANYEWSS